MKSLFSLLFGLLIASPPAVAQELAPDAMVRQVTEDVLTVVRQDKDIQSGNTRKAIDLVETKVLPYFNFQRMTALAVGRDWSKATPEQKKRLSEEFKTLLVRTYSNALTSYKNQTVVYKPSRMQPAIPVWWSGPKSCSPAASRCNSITRWRNRVTAGRSTTSIVAGVSLVTNYRDTFKQEVSNKGIDGLITMLADRNKQLEAGKK
jgi:phospholipid transport system substrate-binding protein